MAEDSAKKSGAEEFVAAEIELAAPLDPEGEKKLRAALDQIDARAFGSIDISAEKISFSYDPTRTNQEALLQLIQEAGGKVQHVESEGSPLL